MGKKPKKLKNPLTRKQIQDFLETFPGKTRTSKRDRLYFKTAFSCGGRSVELLHMRFEDLYLDEDGDPYYHLQAQYSKNKKEIFIVLEKPIYDELLTLKKVYGGVRKGFVFRPISKNEPLDDSYVRRKAGVHGKKAGIPFPVGTHSCRRTFAYHMFKKTNGDIYTVSKLLNHSNLNSTMPYLKMFMDDRKRAIKGLNITGENPEETP